MASLPQLHGQYMQLSAFDLVATKFGFSNKLYFLSQDDSTQAVAAERFNAALKSLINRCPLVAGRVSGAANAPKDLCLSYQTDVPSDVNIDELDILHINTLDETYEARATNNFAGQDDELSKFFDLVHAAMAGPDKPVIAFQLTFLQGGMVLGCTSNHAIMDGGSNLAIMGYLAEELKGSNVAKEHQQAMPQNTFLGRSGLHKRMPIFDGKRYHRPLEYKIRTIDPVPPEAPKTDEVVGRRFAFRLDNLGQIKNRDGSNVTPFRAIAALMYIGITRARHLAGISPPQDSSRRKLAVISSFRKTLDVPNDAIGNTCGYAMLTFDLNPLLGGGPLKDIPDILTDTIESINDIIVKSRTPKYIEQRVGWLCSAIYKDNVKASDIVNDIDSRTDGVIVNSWESKWVKRYEFATVGEVDCVRRAWAVVDGYVLIEPRDPDGEIASVSVGLKAKAMEELVEQLDGWIVEEIGDGVDG